MEIYLTIKYIYPSITEEEFQVLDDNQWEWAYIVWNTTKITQPTQAELDSAWAELQIVQAKQEDIKTFCDAYNLVTNINYKLSTCNENINKQWCTLENKALIQMQIDNFTIKLTNAETNRDTLLAANIATHTDWSDAQKLALVQEFNDALIWNT